MFNQFLFSFFQGELHIYHYSAIYFRHPWLEPYRYLLQYYPELGLNLPDQEHNEHFCALG